MAVAITGSVVFAALCQAEPIPAKMAASTPGGNSITPPVGWHIATSGATLLFEAPEGDLSLAVIDVGDAQTARDAVREAWTIFRPNDRHKVSVEAPRPARHGWDERVSFEYETFAAEHLELNAVALRHGRNWTVVIADGSQATAEKRYAAISLAQTSLHPAGFVKESFAGRAAHSLDPLRVAAMRAFMQPAIGELAIPGASFALIDHGRVVYEGGVGVRQLGSFEPVDSNTRFMIASNTKGMTTLLLATLGSGLVDHSQKMTVAARATAAKKVVGHRS